MKQNVSQCNSVAHLMVFGRQEEEQEEEQDQDLHTLIKLVSRINL